MSTTAAPGHAIFSPGQRERLEHNLACLEERQPDVAQAVRNVTIPERVIPAIGRDGAPTFQIRHKDGDAPAWFGRSSMPTISAREALAAASYQGGNAALPGILTGMEPLVLLDRLPPFAALFVLEDDPTNLALAFALYDYTAMIGAGRLIFLLTDDLSTNFARFIRAHPGYEMPSHLYHVPQRSSAELIELQRALEQGGQSAVAVQEDKIRAVVRNIADQPRRGLEAAPRVALLSAEPRPATLQQVKRFARALKALGWIHEVSAPFTPDQRHHLARLMAIERCSAEVVLFVNTGVDDIRGALPENMPVITWCTAVSEVDRLPQVTAHGPFDLTVYTGPAIPECAAPAHGGRAVIRVEPASDACAFRNTAEHEEVRNRSEVDVVIPADLPDDRAEACGVTLVGHTVLWNAVCRIAAERIDWPTPPDANQILAEAIRSTDVPLDDEGVRRRFAEVIRTNVIPAAVGRSLVQACSKAGLRVVVLGQHRRDVNDLSAQHGGAIPHATGVNPLFDAARAVVLPSCEAVHVQMALDALSAGFLVFMRSEKTTFVRCYPGLADVADHIHFAPTSRRVATEVRALLRDRELKTAHSSDKASSGGFVAGHTVVDRLRWLIDLVRVNARP